MSHDRIICVDTTCDEKKKMIFCTLKCHINFWKEIRALSHIITKISSMRNKDHDKKLFPVICHISIHKLTSMHYILWEKILQGSHILWQLMCVLILFNSDFFFSMSHVITNSLFLDIYFIVSKMYTIQRWKSLRYTKAKPCDIN